VIAILESDNGRKYFVMARCDEHVGVGQFNDKVSGIAECGACIGEDTFELFHYVLLPALEGYADRLTHHAVLKLKLAQARNMLNLLSPGAGDWLDADIDEEHLKDLPPLE
jgi:hypothetical protein